MRRTLIRVTIAGSAAALGVGLLAPAAVAHDRDGRGGVGVQAWDRDRDRRDGVRRVDPAQVAQWRQAKRDAVAERAAAWEAAVAERRAAKQAAVAERAAAWQAAVADRRAATDAEVADRRAAKQAAVAQVREQWQAKQQAVAAAQLEAWRSKVLAAVDRKVTVLGQVETRVVGSDRLPEEDKATIVAGIRSAQENLAGVRAQVAAATTGQEVASAIHSAWQAYGLGHDG